jgi:hypothetical protein
MATGRTTTWHKLLLCRGGLRRTGGHHVWSQNVRMVKNTCYRKHCPGKPFLCQGYFWNVGLLWYAPHEVVQSVHVTNGLHVTEAGCGTCAVCSRVHGGGAAPTSGDDDECKVYQYRRGLAITSKCISSLRLR